MTLCTKEVHNEGLSGERLNHVNMEVILNKFSAYQ